MTTAPAASFTIAVFGIRWRVDVAALIPDHIALARRLTELWSRALVAPDGTELNFMVVGTSEAVPVDENGIRRGVAFYGDAARFPYALSRAVTMASVSVRRGSAVVLHAAGLSVPPMEPANTPAPVLVLVAPSGTGKSTAVRTLGKTWGYVTDEAVVIERGLAVSSYPKPVSLAAADRPGDKDEHSPDDLGLAPTPQRVRVGAVVVLRRASEASEPLLEEIGLVDAMLDVLPQTVSIRLVDRPLHRLAEALTAGGGPFRLTYRDIDNCRYLLGELAAQLSDSDRLRRECDPVLWTGHPSVVEGDAIDNLDEVRQDGADVDDDTILARAPWTDAVESGGELLVLLGARPVRLAGAGPAVWIAASAPMSLNELIEKISDGHAVPCRRSSDVANAIRQMLLLRVLTSYPSHKTR